MSKKIKLGKLPAGKVFKYNDTYALKSEYRNDRGICECYIIGSGERFWGGTSDLNNLEVEPVYFEPVDSKDLKEFNIFEETKNKKDTNIKDINGRPIFEGDVLFDSLSTKGIVFYLDGKYQITSDSGGYDITDVSDCDYLTEEIVKDVKMVFIGNIHDNPSIIE